VSIENIIDKEKENFKVLKDWMDGKIKEKPTKWAAWQLRPEANCHMTLNSRVSKNEKRD